MKLLKPFRMNTNSSRNICPDDDISKKDMERLSQEIKELGKELRMLRRIKKTEQEFAVRKTKKVTHVPESRHV